MSLRKAINDKCKDCIYDPKCGGGTWRQQVEACAITSCPLWSVRPKSASVVAELAHLSAEQHMAATTMADAFSINGEQ